MTFDQFLNKYERKPVNVFPYGDKKNVLVSVCVVTYNHVNFIKQCLDNILNQSTNFDYEILLGEDASTDGTREICIDYATKHLSKIRLFLHHRENNIKIGDRPTGRFNFIYNLYSTRGKYIAMCEGDDYWTDPFKLQKQVDFLENNKSFSFCATSYHILNNEKITEVNLGVSEIIHDSIFFKNRQATASLVFRNEIIKDYLETENIQVKAADWLIQSLACVNHGPGKCLDFFSTVYRIHENGMWSSYGKTEKGRAGVNVLISFKNIFKDVKSQNLIDKAIINRKKQFNLDLNSKLYNKLNFKKRILNVLNKFNI